MPATATAQAWNNQWWGKRKKPLPISKATNLPIKKHLTAAQKVQLLQQIEKLQAQNKTIRAACRRYGVCLTSYFRWRRTFELTRSQSDGILYYSKISPKERDHIFDI
jgi:transposase-like protein